MISKDLKKKFTMALLFSLVMGQASAETIYVTDRILLGIHVGADESTNVIKSVPSGTEMEVLDRLEGFINVRLKDGTVGWVSEGFVMDKVPATRRYDVLATQYEKTTQQLDKVKKDLEKTERELQVRRDQVSNSSTTIKNLKKQLSGKIVVDPEMENKLNDAVAENETLKAKITELENQIVTVENTDNSDAVKQLNELKQNHEMIQTRIDVALAHLKGERIPSPEELASIRPKFPNWYWTLLVAVLLVGAIGGYFFMDYRYRRRHGGFRL